MKPYFLIWVALPLWINCQHLPAHEEDSQIASPPLEEEEKLLALLEEIPIDSQNTPATRFPPPEGYQRIGLDSISFAYYLRHFPLHPPGHPVHLYNGELKINQRIHAAVLNIDTGSRDLQQCADAIMRLWAEYNYEKKKYQAIQFHFVNGFLADYPTWKAGNSISVQGNHVKWVPSTKANSSYTSFRRYLRMVFSYAGTLSLNKELKEKALNSMEIGDVFIQGGSPGHAILIVDMAINPENGDKAFLLAQSYMPAQEIHILKNFENRRLSPWYSLKDIGDRLHTPEWSFFPQDLKGF